MLTDKSCCDCRHRRHDSKPFVAAVVAEVEAADDAADDSYSIKYYQLSLNVAFVYDGVCRVSMNVRYCCCYGAHDGCGGSYRGRALFYFAAEPLDIAAVLLFAVALAVQRLHLAANEQSLTGAAVELADTDKTEAAE